ncbi:MAG: DNA polymerase IV [Methanoregulaceae archaeon]|nr:MAG: DNA polymerase IV [Methanoregulaceae archaeon]
MTAISPADSNPVPLAVPQGPVQNRIILHMDMDSFYASVEMQRRPELQNKPVVIGADPKGGHGRGVVCTCSYEARAFGIRSAMPVSHAYVLCPHAVFLSPDYSHYSRISAEIMDVLCSFGYRFLQVSIDEAFLDISPCGSYGAAAMLAVKIQKMIKSRFCLTCSVGIAPGKTVAKIASDYKKPGGLTVVEPQTVQTFLASLPVRKIPGVGKKSEAQLLELGIRTVGDLAASDIQMLIGRFGQSAVSLHALATGTDTSQLENYKGVRSLSRETTFESDTDDPDLLVASLDTLTASVHRTLSEETLRCRTVTVKIRYHGFVTRTKSRTISHFTDSADQIRSCTRALFREIYDGRKVRLIGVRLSSFGKPDQYQMTLVSGP